MKLCELAEHIGGVLRGDGQASVSSVASLQDAGAGDVSFVTNARYAGQAEQSEAAGIIVPSDFERVCKSALILVDDVDEAIERVLVLFAPERDAPAVGVDVSACVADSAKLGGGVAIGATVVIGHGVSVGNGSELAAGCVIGRDVTIGANCRLGPNVVVNERCVLGDNVIIHANSTIGADGFGYRFVDGAHRKVPHIGIVVIEDDVEIGANSCVDRAKFGKTIIGRGTKIDNLVQIAHNVSVGEHCIIVSQTGIAGSSELGKYVTLGGQCGIADHVRIGDGVMAGATSSVAKDVPAGLRIVGTPARPAREFFRELSHVAKLPELAKEVKRLRKQVDASAASKDDR